MSAAATAIATTAECSHKSAIGCMLTVVRTCCACADKRPLVAAYPVYVDGQGVKMQGKRWQRYCRRCKDHWNQYTSTSTDAHATTSSPHTSPGARRNEPLRLTPANVMAASPPGLETDLVLPQTPSLNIDAVRLFGHESSFSFQSHPARLNQTSHIAAQASNAEPSSTASVTDISFRERGQRQQREQGPEEGLRDSPEDVGRQLRQQQVEQRRERQPANPRRQRPAYPLGTIEDVQQDDYVSPIGEMFTRAWARYGEAQARARAQDPDRDQDHHNLSRRYVYTGETGNTGDVEPRLQSPRQHHHHHRHTHDAAVAPLERQQTPILPSLDSTTNTGTDTNEPDGPNWIDSQVNRPPPLATGDDDDDAVPEESRCKICTEQKIDIVLHPCQHALMCRWCAEVMWHDARSGPHGRRFWLCPICRTRVQESVKVRVD